jgi:hypothetical protein
MVGTTWVVLALLPAVAFLLYHQLWRWRNKFAHIPSSLVSNLFYGHIGYMAAGFKKAAIPHLHPGTYPYNTSTGRLPLTTGY